MRLAPTLLCLSVAALLLPGAAQACRFLPYEPAEAPIFGKACTARWTLETDRMVELGEAYDLGAGITLQRLTDGNGCDMEVHLVVHDCGTADVIRIGPVRQIAGDPDESGQALEDLAAYLDGAEAGTPTTLAGIEERASALGLEVSARVISGQKVQAGDFDVTTGCACSLFYDGGGG